MELTILGPGLVGSYLGAAAGAPRCVPGPSRRVHGRRVHLPTGERGWSPQLIELADHPAHTPLLVACRVPNTPWPALPRDCVVAQNGLGQPAAVAVCFLALDRDQRGVVMHHGPPPRVVISSDPMWREVVAAWRAAGISVEQRQDVRPAQWEKAALNATVGPLCLALGLGMAEVWNDPSLRALVRAATDEAVAIAASAGITIAAGIQERAATFFAAVGAHRPSVLSSANELPWVLDALLMHAQQGGTAAPALARIAELVERRLVAASTPA